MTGLPTLKWRPLEIVFWLLPVAAFFVFPRYLTLGSQILIAGLFALSLDLILGYAGSSRSASRVLRPRRVHGGVARQVRLGRAAERTLRGGGIAALAGWSRASSSCAARTSRG